MLARGPAHFDVSLARGTARFDLSLARGTARFDHTLYALFLCLCLASASPALASPWAARSSGSLAGMLSADQIGHLGYNSLGFLGSLSLLRELVPYLGAQASVRGGSFLSSRRTGGVVGFGLGLWIHGREKPIMPYVSAEAGAAFTGRLTRPWLSAVVGVDFRVTPALTLGPIVGIDDVVQDNRPGSSSDAVFMWLGLAFRYWPAALPAAAKPKAEAARAEPPPVRETEAVDDHELLSLIERSIDPLPVRHELLAPVLFAGDSALLDAQAIAMLHEVLHTLKRYKAIRLVEIRGYADRRGSEAHNRVLSEERARQVEGWLIEHGISPSRLRVVAEGEREPVELGQSPDANAQNRRVVFRILETSQP